MKCFGCRAEVEEPCILHVLGKGRYSVCDTCWEEIERDWPDDVGAWVEAVVHSALPGEEAFLD